MISQQENFLCVPVCGRLCVSAVCECVCMQYMCLCVHSVCMYVCAQYMCVCVCMETGSVKQTQEELGWLSLGRGSCLPHGPGGQSEIL